MRKKWLTAWIRVGVLAILTVPAFFYLDVSASDAAQNVRFAVLSDIHYYDSSLGTSGLAFETYLMTDRKMLRESEAITNAAISQIAVSDVQFLLVSGDMTKDGELICHNDIAAYFKYLEDLGIQVYVIPGNHDINNPDAVSYSGATKTPVAKITPDDFVQIYGQFGFQQALARDPNSLSYLVEPMPGFCVLAMDSCRYRENVDTPIVGGRFSQDTLNWILSQVAWAKENNKQIIGMMHHGIVEHFSLEAAAFSDYLVDDWQNISKLFADAGLRLVFTGHFHAQDAVKKTVQAGTQPSFIFDVETGSLVTYPVPYRLVTYYENMSIFQIESKVITQIDYDTHGIPFQQYAKEYVDNGLTFIVATFFIYYFDMEPADAETYAQYLVSGMIANYAGDENPTIETLETAMGFLQMSEPIMKLIGMSMLSLWNDPLPADNNLYLELNNGLSYPR